MLLSTTVDQFGRAPALDITIALPRSGLRREPAVPGEKFDHQPVEQPGLLDLAGMSGSRQHLHFAAGNARLEREGALMGGILATAENDSRAADPRLMIFGVRLRMRLELTDDRRQIAVRVALGEQVGEEARHWGRPEGGAEVVERVAPTIVDAMLLVGLDAAMGELLARVVPGAGQDQRRRLLRAPVMHVSDDSRADGAANEDRLLAGSHVVDRLPAALRGIRHGQAGPRLR